MGKHLIKKHAIEFLLGSVIVVAVIAALLFWKEPIPPAPAKPAKIVLRSSLADKGWYPADGNTLSKQIEGFFHKANVKPISDAIALILPHAGYRFSGQTAACGLKTIEKQYKRIVIMGPSHYVGMEEVLSVPRATHYQTPLGQIPLDTEFINRLLKFPMFQNIPHTHKYEHSVQIQLPLLQYKQKDFKLVPIVAGTCSLRTITAAANILKGLIDRQTLIIASSDFTHYGPNYGYVPFKQNIPEQLKKLDMGAYDYIASLDTKGFWQYKRNTGINICGYVPITILLSMLEKPARAELVKYTTSGRLTDDFTNSVSYFAIAFTSQWQNHPPVKPPANNPGLTDDDKKKLLTLARKTLAYAVKKQQILPLSELGFTFSDTMWKPRAAFVTLKKNHQLRGCIGDIFPVRPLCRSVILNAINAGLNDRRFLPVTEAECNDITIEISALTAPEPISSPEEIRIGIDGVMLNKNGHSAVFLPQVAPEQGWDLNQMLTHLSQKAGLAPDAWKKGASFLVFQADVFGEEQ